jgi:hypothetical protein
MSRSQPILASTPVSCSSDVMAVSMVPAGPSRNMYGAKRHVNSIA